jgi:hypothetical protein
LLLPLFGEVEEICCPKEFFDLNRKDLEQVVEVVRNGFGRDLDFQDIYQHVTLPEKVYLLRNEKIQAMASYNTRNFAGVNSLIGEGIALNKDFQGKGIFSILTNQALSFQEAVCLRTQNPRMYRALQNFCKETFPSERSTPKIIRRALNEFAEYTNSKLDDFGVVRGYYGSLFYGCEPTHLSISKFFKENLKMDLSKGDAVLAIGLI